MSKSIADGAKLTPETFADFIERLKYHHRGEGVSRHITADPIFMVQKESTIYGMDTDYCDGRFVMAMKYSWFHHHECTTEQADELEARYRAKQIRTERSLDNDFIHWTISAFLPEVSKPPRQDRTWQQRIWR